MTATNIDQQHPEQNKAWHEADYYDEGVAAIQGCVFALLVTVILWAVIIVAVWQMVGGGR